MTKMTPSPLALAALILAPAVLAQTAPGAAPGGFSAATTQKPAGMSMHVDGAAACTLDWREVVGGAERVVFIGDVRSSAAIKSVLAGAMLDFARAGAGALAVDAVRPADQPLLDRYGAPDARRLLGERLAKEKLPAAADELALFDAAHAAGLSLFALNPNPAAALGALSKRPGGGRVIVFIAADQARRGAQPAQLRDAGVPSRSYAFASAADPSEQSLRVAGLDTGDWLLPGDADFDGLISVPAVLRDTPAR
jgi:hypothetical protein